MKKIEPSPYLIENFNQMKKTLNSIEYLKSQLAQYEAEARKLLKDDIEEDIEKALAEQIRRLSPMVEKMQKELDEDEKSRKQNAKEKTLRLAREKAESIGAKLIDRPRVSFGAAEDSTVRIVAMGRETKYGIPTLIWYKGGSWSDNGGVHYTPSWLEMRWTFFEEFNGKKVLKQRRYVSDPEARLPKELLSGGKLTVPRLKEIEDQIGKHIKGYKAHLAPWTHIIIYT